MPRGIEINSNTTRVREAFAQYASYRKRDREEAFRDQARKLAVELYNQTAAIAPTEAQVASTVRALGWHIPAYFGAAPARDGKGRIVGPAPGSRIGRGVVAQWVGVAWEKQKPKRRRGRPTKAQQKRYDKKQAAFFDDYFSRPSLDQMQAFVIMMRTNARLYLASGWLGAVVSLGGSVKARAGGQSGSGAVSSERGGAFVTVADGLMSVTIWNRSVGIEDVDAKRGFVAAAVAVRVEDMWVYVRRKEQEGLARLKRVN